IELYSMCEHHLLPFIGRAHVAYIPNGKVIGLSKVARIVDVFARRLQIQENLTTQIAESLMNCLEPNGVAVVVEAKHLCMMIRGGCSQRNFPQKRTASFSAKKAPRVTAPAATMWPILYSAVSPILQLEC